MPLLIFLNKYKQHHVADIVSSKYLTRRCPLKVVVVTFYLFLWLVSLVGRGICNEAL